MNRPLQKHVLVVVALLALDVAIFHGVFFEHLTYPFDFGATYYALSAYWIASVQHGEWPGWVPYLGMGYPFAANAQSAAFYPFLWVFILWRQPLTLHAASVLEALHVAAGSLGAYFLIRRLYRSDNVALVGGAAYMLYGGFYTNAQHTDIVRAFALLPWLIWAILLPSDEPRVLRSCLTLSRPALALPLLTYLLVTGGYPGVLIAFLFVFPFFLTAQVFANTGAGQPFKSAVLDAALIVGLVGLGIALAAAFVLPVAALSTDLTRSTDLANESRVLFQWRDLYELMNSSTYLRQKDDAMFGMQLSVVLLPCLAFVGRSTLPRVAPLLVTAAIAVLMSFEGFTPISDTLIRLAPPLGLSRFPVGDYRTFIALAVLVVICGGLGNLIANANRPKATTLRYGIGLALLLVLDVPTLIGPLATSTQSLALTVLFLQIFPALLLFAFLPHARRTLVLRSLPAAIAVSTVLSAVPVIADLGGYWITSERAIVENAGFDPNAAGTWTPDAVFTSNVRSRPARETASNEFAISWHGYLAGNFMADDYGGTILRARRTIESNPQLLAFATAPLTLVADGEGFNWQPLRYGRSSIIYHVSLPEAALVTENEIFSKGWQARFNDGPPIDPIEVNGGFRGWRLPAGDYDLELSYSTPLFGLGIAVSLATLGIYAVVLVSAARYLRMRAVVRMSAEAA